VLESIFSDLINLSDLAIIQESGIEGKTWRIQIIREGWSLNNVYYSREALEKSIPIFEGVKVFSYEFANGWNDHLPAGRAIPQGYAQNLVGWIDNIKFETVNESSGLTGNFHITNSHLREAFKNSWAENKKDLLEFSIDARANVLMGMAGGRTGKIVTEILEANSVDVVTKGAAGGKVLRLVASATISEAMWDTQYINNLSDSSFALILPGGEKDQENKTTPRSLRKLPYKNIDGAVDLPHLRNALARLPQTDLTPEQKAKAAEVLQKAAEKSEIKVSEGGNEMFAKLIAMIRDNPDAIGITDDLKNKTDEEIMALIKGKLTEAVKPTEPEKPMEQKQEAVAKEADIKAMLEMVAKLAEKKAEPVKESVTAVDKEFGKDALDRIKKMECKVILEDALKESKLPDAIQAKIMKQFSGKVFEEKEIQESIKIEKEVYDQLVESGKAKGMSVPTVEVGLNESDRMQKSMDILIDPDVLLDANVKESYKGIPRAQSIKELYIRMTGDVEVRGIKDQQRVTEAASTSDFTALLGTSMNKRLSREYARQDIAASWRKLVSVRGIDNFKRQDIIRVGGFANLSTVSENAAYTEFSTPAEANPNYTPAKYGNIFKVSREMIKNDDLRFMRVWPSRMAQSAARTLAKFVFDLITGNDGSTGAVNDDTIWDGYALYDSSNHSNYTTSALSFATLDAAITAMANQAEASSSEPLNVAAAYLLVAHEKRALAKILVESETKPNSQTASDVTNSEINPNYKSVEPIVVPKYFLGNQSNNWYVAADPMKCETVEIGFMDNRQEPEILSQDQETTGTVFTHDQITFKCRHEYGGAVVDFRGLYGGIVGS